MVLPLPRVQPPTHGDERVVPRPLSLGRRLGITAVGLLAVVLALAATTASAANRRVAIGHYQWSLPQIHVNLGEHVSWYWVGPDTMHSVTGTSPNDAAGTRTRARARRATTSATPINSPSTSRGRTPSSASFTRASVAP